MAYIKVDFTKLKLMQECCDMASGRIGIVRDRVVHARENLDWQVSIQENISGTLKKIAADLDDACTKLKNINNFLGYALVEYQKAETMTAEEIRAENKRKAEAIFAEVRATKVNFAVEKATATDDPGMVFLGSVRETNEKLGMQVSAYAYEVGTLDVSGVVKKAVKGSEDVNRIKEAAIRNSIDLLLESEKLSGQFAEGKVSCEDFAKATFETAGIAAESVDAITGTSTEAGKVISLLKFAYETGIDLSEYNQMSRQQQEVLLNNLEQSAYKKALLEEIAAAYPEDEYLVDYCNDVIENEIMRDLREKSEIILRNSRDVVIDEGVSNAIAFAENGNLAVIAIKSVGLMTELIAGTDTTVQTLEYIDILHTDIEACSTYYENAVASGNVSDETLRFQELYMLNMKMAGVELAKNINKTSLQQKNLEYLDNLEKITKSYQDAYVTIVTGGTE